LYYFEKAKIPLIQALKKDKNQKGDFEPKTPFFLM
jgi:hypothetical protein